MSEANKVEGRKSKVESRDARSCVRGSKSQCLNLNSVTELVEVPELN